MGLDAGTQVQIDVGQVIAGKYELVKLLGKGAMGEVWLATHNTLGGEFAIKLVEPADDIEAETAAGRFQLEAQIAAKLSRKTRHVVSVSDHGEEAGLAYLVMERLEGESLEARVHRAGPIPLHELAAIVSQVARALSVAHEEGVFHRDLKPANVWLGRDEDERLLVKLLDFGIARSVKPFRTRSPFATSKDMVLGTPSYMSPEQARGLDSLDYRCDLWALAVGAYEALTGSIPFEGTTVEDVFLSICTFRVVPLHSRRPDLPASVEAFFARAFTPNVDERFQSAAELSEAFERLVGGDRALAISAGLSPVSTWRQGSSPELIARGRLGSSPDLASAAGVAINVPLAPPSSSRTGSQVDTPSGGLERTFTQSSPEFENVALHGPRPSQRPGTRGWVFGSLALFALLGLGVFAFVTYREAYHEMSTAQPAEPPPTATTLVLSEPAPTLAEPTPTPVTTAEAKPMPLVPTARSKAGTPAKASAHHAPVAPPAQQPAAVVPATPAPAPGPTPTAKAIDKGGIF